MAGTNRTLLANYLLGQNSSYMGRNYIRNQMALNNTENVSAVNSATVSQNLTTPLNSMSDFALTLPNNTNGYVEWALNSLDRNLSGKTCELKFDYSASSIGSAVQAQILQGSTVVASRVLNTIDREVLLTAPCGDLSTATTIRITNVTGNTGTSALNVTNVTYGKGSSASPVSQASMVGSGFFAEAGSACVWARSAASFGSFTAVGACPGPTVTTNVGPGVIQTTDSDLPRFTVNNLPPGTYAITFTGTNYRDAVSDTAVAVSDGTDTRGQVPLTGGSTAATSFSTTGVFTYAVAGNRSFELVGYTTAGGLYVPSSTVPLRVEFNIVRFPAAGELAIRPDQSDFPWTRSAALEATTGVWSGLGTITGPEVYISRQGDSLWIRSRVKAGTVAPAPYRMLLSAAGLTIDTAKLGTLSKKLGTCDLLPTGTAIELSTANNYHTAYYNGSDGNNIYFTRATTSFDYRASNGNDYVAANDVLNCVIGPIPITGWTGNQSAPLLVGSVTSNSSGTERVERAVIAAGGTACTGSPCTISRQSGNWLTSVTRSGAGSYTLNFASGIFLAPPTCVFATQSPGPARVDTAPTTSAFSYTVVNAAGSAVDTSDMHVLCMGPR